MSSACPPRPPRSPAQAFDALKAAYAYAARGWRVLPLAWPALTGERARCACRVPACERIGKHPLFRSWPEQASTDPERIRAWWKRSPLANVGILMGPESGIFALDVDPRHGGDSTLVDLVREHGPIGDTLQAFTGSGGDHIFFRWPEQPIVNGAGKLGLGIDVMGAGSYVVAAPSLHASGERYAWGPAREPLDAPPWLLALLRPPEPPSGAPAPPRSPVRSGGRRPSPEERAELCLSRMRPAIQGSGGQRTLYRAALAMVHGFDLDAGTALRLILDVYVPRCVPPWEPREQWWIKRAVERARASSPTRPIGYLLHAEKAR